MTTNNKHYSKSSPGMWILFFVTLAITVGVTIYVINTLISAASGTLLPTKVFTIDDDVVSIQLPEDWVVNKDSSKKAITWNSKNGYEGLSIAAMDESNLKDASIIYMLELKETFQGVSTENLTFEENTINGKPVFAVNVMYQSRYYLCGVMESGNTIIKFVYSASLVTGEISDIDTIIGSINYRKGGVNRE
jgi:hypothetical protein